MRWQVEQACLGTNRWVLVPTQQEGEVPIGGKGSTGGGCRQEEGGCGCSLQGSYLRDLLGVCGIAQRCSSPLSAVRTRKETARYEAILVNNEASLVNKQLSVRNVSALCYPEGRVVKHTHSVLSHAASVVPPSWWHTPLILAFRRQRQADF